MRRRVKAVDTGPRVRGMVDERAPVGIPPPPTPEGACLATARFVGRLQGPAPPGLSVREAIRRCLPPTQSTTRRTVNAIELLTDDHRRLKRFKERPRARGIVT